MWEETLPKLMLNKPQPLLVSFLHHKEASWAITFLENYLEMSKEQSKLVAVVITALKIDSVHTTCKKMCTKLVCNQLQFESINLSR